MELDELKAGWNVLNERLREQEILNKRIIREMISNRTKSAYALQYRHELMGVLIITFFVLFFPFMRSQAPTVTTGSFIWLESIIAISAIHQLYLFSFLARFNLESKSLCELKRLILGYKQQRKLGIISGIVLAIAGFAGFLILQNGALTHEAWKYVMAVAIIAVTFITGIWIYRRHTLRISAIEQGLEELKEFEEE